MFSGISTAFGLNLKTMFVLAGVSGGEVPVDLNPSSIDPTLGIALMTEDVHNYCKALKREFEWRGPEIETYVSDLSESRQEILSLIKQASEIQQTKDKDNVPDKLKGLMDWDVPVAEHRIEKKYKQALSSLAQIVHASYEIDSYLSAMGKMLQDSGKDPGPCQSTGFEVSAEVLKVLNVQVPPRAPSF